MNLNGHTIGLSLSPPADMIRLGFPLREFDRLAYELAMRIILAGGRVLYGGHLQEGSLTVTMFDYLSGAYATGGISGEPRDRPFIHLLSSSEFIRTPFPRLIETLRASGGFAETSVVLGVDKLVSLSARRTYLDGHPTDSFELIGRASNANETKIANQQELRRFQKGMEESPMKAASHMRAAAERLVSARISAGGKRGDTGFPDRRDIYDGSMPGIWEEVIHSLVSEHPIIVLGAYGGAARDAAIGLDLMGQEHRVPYLGEQQDGLATSFKRLLELRPKIPAEKRETLKGFAVRSDTEALAKDIVRWLISQIRSDPPRQLAIP